MKATEKLLKKEFKLKSLEELWLLIDKKHDTFFQYNFFCDKITYKKNLDRMIAEIDADGELIGQEIAAMKSGSIIQNFASAAYTQTIGKYLAMRKALLNQIRLILSK